MWLNTFSAADEPMPHCILDCSRTIEKHANCEAIINAVHSAAAGTGLFAEGDVKVRMNLFEHYTAGGTPADFVHTIVYLLAGRTLEQRQNLSSVIVKELKQLLPDVPIISLDIREIDRATYNNRETV